MSIVHKLENAYVTILRVVIVIVSSLLLTGAAWFGMQALKGMLAGDNSSKMQVQAVNPNDVLAAIVAPEDQAQNSAGQSTGASQQDQQHPYQGEYDQIYKVVSEFVSTRSKQSQSVEKEDMFDFLDGRIEDFDEPELKAAYIKGLAAAYQTSLSDKRVIALFDEPPTPRAHQVAAQLQHPASAPSDVDAAEDASQATDDEELTDKEMPLDIVNEVQQAYHEMFTEKVTQASEQQKKADMEQAQDQASAGTRLMLGAGMFAAFLLVVFQSVAIRIERYLREIATAQAARQQAVNVL